MKITTKALRAAWAYTGIACMYTNNHLTIFQASEIDRNFVETIIKKNKKIFLAYISTKDKI